MDSADRQARLPPLVCVECERIQPTAKRGWRSYLTVADEEPAEAVVYVQVRLRRPMLA
jgi:hypothetical protein